MNEAVDEFRKTFASDPRSDEEITVFLDDNFPGQFDGYAGFQEDLQKVRQENRSLELEERRENAPGLLQEMNLGLGRATEGLMGTLKGATALGLRALPGEFADETSDRFLEEAQGHGERAAEYAGTIRSVEEIETFSDFIRYISGGIGEVTPSIAEAITTAIAGGVAGGATAGPVGGVGGFMGGLVGKRAAKKLLNKKVKDLLEERAQREVGKEMVDSIEDQLKKVAAGKMLAEEADDQVKDLLSREMRATRRRYGANAAVLMNSQALSSGEIFNELTENGISPDEAVNTAVGGGFLAALPDSALPMAVINRVTGGVPPGLKKPFIERLLGHWATVPAAMGGESITEAYQELVNIMALRFEQGGIDAMNPATNPLTDEDKSRLKNAGALGAIGGGLAGGSAFAFSKLLSPKQEQEDRDKADRISKTGKREKVAEQRMKDLQILANDLIAEHSTGQGPSLETQSKIQAIPDGQKPVFAAFVENIRRRMDNNEIDPFYDLDPVDLELESQAAGPDISIETERVNAATRARPDLAQQVLRIVEDSSSDTPLDQAERVATPLNQAERVTKDLVDRGVATQEQAQEVLDPKYVQLGEEFDPDRPLGERPGEITANLEDVNAEMTRRLGISEVELGSALGQIESNEPTISAEGVDLALAGAQEGAVAPAQRESGLEGDVITDRQLSQPLTQDQVEDQRQEQVRAAVAAAQEEGGFFSNTFAEEEGTEGFQTRGEASQERVDATLRQKMRKRLKWLASRQKVGEDPLGRKKLSEVVDPRDEQAREQQEEEALVASFDDVTLAGPNPRSDSVVMIDIRDTQNVSLDYEHAPFAGTFILTEFTNPNDAIAAFAEEFADFGGAELIGAATVIDQARLDAYRKKGKRDVGVKSTKDPGIPFARLSSFKGKIPEGAELRDTGIVKGKVSRTITQPKSVSFKLKNKKGVKNPAKWGEDETQRIVDALNDEGIHAYAGTKSANDDSPNGSVIVHGLEDVYAVGETAALFKKARNIIKRIDNRPITESVKKAASEKAIYETQQFESQFPKGDPRVQEFTLIELSKSLLESVDWLNNHDVEEIGIRQDPGAFNPRAWFRINGLADPSLLTAQFTGSGQSKNSTSTRRFTFFLFPDGKVRLLGTKRSPVQSGKSRADLVMAWPEHETLQAHPSKKAGMPKVVKQGKRFNQSDTDPVTGLVSWGRAVPLTDALEAGAIPIASIKLAAAQTRTSQRTIAAAHWTLGEFEDIFARQADLLSDTNRPQNILAGEQDAGGVILDEEGFTPAQREEQKNLTDLERGHQLAPRKFAVDEDGNVQESTQAGSSRPDRAREADFMDSTSNTATESVPISNTHEIIHGMWEVAPMDDKGIIRDRDKKRDTVSVTTVHHQRDDVIGPPTASVSERRAKPGAAAPKTLTKKEWNIVLDKFLAQSDNQGMFRWMLARSGEVILRVFGPSQFIGISQDENRAILRGFIQNVTYQAYEQGKFDKGKSVVEDFFSSSEENLRDALNIPELKSLADGVNDIIRASGSSLREKNTTRFTLVDVDLMADEAVDAYGDPLSYEERENLRRRLRNRQNLTQDWIEYVRLRAIMDGRGNPKQGDKWFEVLDEFDAKKSHAKNRSDLKKGLISEGEFEARKAEISEMAKQGVGGKIQRVKAAIDRSLDPILAPVTSRLMYPSVFGYPYKSPTVTALDLAVTRNEMLKDVRDWEAYTETMAALTGLTSSKDQAKQDQNERRSRRALGWSIGLATGEDIEVSEETFNVLHRADLPEGSRLQTLQVDLTTGSPIKSPGELQQEANELNALIASWSELTPEQMSARHDKLAEWGLIEAAERYAYGLLKDKTVTQSEAEGFAGGEISGEVGKLIAAERGPLPVEAEAARPKAGTLASLDQSRRKAQSEAQKIDEMRMWQEEANNESSEQRDSIKETGRYDPAKPSGQDAVAFPAKKTRGPRRSLNDPIVKPAGTPIGQEPAMEGPARQVAAPAPAPVEPAKKSGVDYRKLLREQPSNSFWATEKGQIILKTGGPHGGPLQPEVSAADEADPSLGDLPDPHAAEQEALSEEKTTNPRVLGLERENKEDQAAPQIGTHGGSPNIIFSRPTSLPSQDVLAEEAYWDLVSKLRDANISVELLDLQLDALTAELLGFHVSEDGNPVENALFNSAKATIVHAMRDTMKPTRESLRILMHETGHVVTMAESKEVQYAVYAAIEKMSDEQLGITESRDPRIVNQAPAYHKKKRWLTSDGFVFTQEDDGTVTDGDMTYDSVEALAEDAGPPRLMGPTEVRGDIDGKGLPDGWQGFMEGSDPESSDPTISDVARQTAESDQLSGGLLQMERLAEALSFYGIKKDAAKTIAAQIIRHIKDALMRVAMFLQRQVLGRDNVNPNLAFAFAKNRFDMLRGKPAPFLSYIGGRNLKPSDMPDLHGKPIRGEGWAKEILAPDGKMVTEQGFAELDDDKTLFNNIFNSDVVFYNKTAQSILSPPDEGGDNSTEIATPWSAAMQSLEDALQMMYAEVGNSGLIDGMTYSTFLKELGMPVAPLDKVNKLNLALQANGQQPVPNVTADKLRGDRGNLIFLQHIRRVHKRFGKKVAAMKRVVKVAEKRKAGKTDRLNKMELNYKNLDLVHKEILATFKRSIVKFGHDIRFMGNPRWVKGLLASAVEKMAGQFKGGAHQKIADDLFKQIDNSNQAFMNFMEGIAGLGIDFTGSPESVIEGLSTPDAETLLKSSNAFARMMQHAKEALTTGPTEENVNSFILYGLIRDLQVSNPKAMAWLEVRKRQNLPDDHPDKISSEETLALKAMIEAIREESGFITPQHERLLTELSSKSRAVGVLASEYTRHKAEMRALDKKIDEAKKFDEKTDVVHNAFLEQLASVEARLGAVEQVEMIEGAMLIVAPSEGATLAEVERANDMGKKLKGGKWSNPDHKRFKFTRRTGRGEDRNAAKMRAVIEVNDKWLKNNEGNQGLIYNTIYDTNMKLKMEEMSPIHRAMKNNLFTKHLSSIVTRLRLTGTDAGRRAAMRITRYNAATEEFESEANVRGSRWEVARGAAVNAMPSIGSADLFMEIVYDGGLKFIENHNYLVEGAISEDEGGAVSNPQEEALKLLKEHLESNPTIAKDIPTAWPAIKELFLETQSINNWFNLTVRVKLGMKVKDDVIGLLRESVGAPLFTVSRTLNSRLASLHYDMSRIGWPGTTKLTDEEKAAGKTPEDLAFNKPNPPPVEDLASAYTADPNALAAKLSMMTPASVVEGFIKPIVEDTGKTHFSAPKNADGIDNIATRNNVSEAWESSYDEATGRVDLIRFAEKLYEYEGGESKLASRNEAAQLRARPEASGVTLPVEVTLQEDMAQFVGDTIDTFYQFFGQISRILQEQEQSALKVGDKNTQTLLPHQLMDARRAENFPAAFLSYNTYDQSTARIMVNQMAVHAHLGRDMREIDADVRTAGVEMDRFAKEYERLIAEFRRSNPSENPETLSPWKNRKFRKSIEAAARVRAEEMGEDPDEFLEKVVGAYDGLPVIHDLMGTLTAWFEAQGSGLIEMKAGMELLNTMTGAIIQGPKTTILNFMSMFDPIAKYGPSKVARKQVLRNWKSLMGETLGSFFQMFNHQLNMNVENVIRRNKVGRFDSSHHLTLKKRLQAVWTQEISGGKIQRGLVRGARAAREVLLETGISRRPKEVRGADGELNSLNTEGPQYPVFRPHASFSTFVQIMNNSMIDGTWEAYGDMVERGVEFAKDPATSGKFREAGFEFTAEDLGYKRRLFGFSDDALAFQKMRVTMQNYGINLEHAVAAAMEEGAPLFTEHQYSLLASMTQNEISLESSITNQPTAFMTQGALRFSKPLLGWSFAKMDQLRGGMRDANDQRYQFMTAMKMFGAMVPLGMAWALLMDQYDEKVIGKKSNLRPLLNPLNPENELLDVGRAFLERTARVGTFGFAGDIAHGMANFQEGGNTRGISFDHRVVFMNAIQGFMQSTTALGRTGLDDATYSSIWRPMMQAMGGTGYLQYAQIINNTVSPDIPFFRDEARVTRRINAQNYLRAMGREMNLDVRTGSGSRSLTNEIKPHVSEMILASLSNDSTLFDMHKREALKRAEEAVRKKGKMMSIAEVRKEAESRVKMMYQSSHPLRIVFKTSPTEMEYKDILSNMPDDGRKDVSQAINLINSYGERHLGVTPNVGSGAKRKKTSTGRRSRADFQRASSVFESPFQ